MNACIASSKSKTPRIWFTDKLKELDILITLDQKYNTIEYNTIYSKLWYQKDSYTYEEFTKLCISKSSIHFVTELSDPDELFKALEAGKAKRNVGDPFKHIVTDNWKTELVMTINLRSLKNFFDLRDSGAAWFQIQWLAEEMKAKTPIKYLRLIDKQYKDK